MMSAGGKFGVVIDSALNIDQVDSWDCLKQVSGVLH